MKVLLIGSEGKIARRYKAILNFFEVETICYDEAFYHLRPSWWNMGIDKAFICCPTPYHHDWCMELMGENIPFICEKPVSKDMDEIKAIIAACGEAEVDGRMCCNYKFALKGKNPLRYSYYNTGGDGIYWDLIQLIYINPDISIDDTGFIWELVCDGGNVTYRDWEIGFYEYINRALFHPEELWDMNDALKATEAVYGRIKRDEGGVSNLSKAILRKPIFGSSYYVPDSVRDD